MTPKEAAAKEAYQKLLNHQAHSENYESVESFDDANVFNLDTFDLEDITFRAMWTRISDSEFELTRRAKLAEQNGEVPTPEESAAAAKW